MISVQGHSQPVPLSFWNMETRHRIGTFCHMVGLTLMVIFIASILSKGTNATYLFLSFAAFFIGIILRRNKPVQDSGRFAFVRRAGQRGQERRGGGWNKKPTGKPVTGGAGFGKSRRDGKCAGQDIQEETDNSQQE